MKKEYYELTNPQKNIWMVELVNDGSNINNIAGVFYIKNDEFKYDIHNEVLNELIKNNEALRLNIIKKGEEPLQYIREFKKQNIEVLDMSLLSEKDFNTYIKNEMLKPINILGEKLYEFKIIKLPNMKTCIYYKFHHIISDAWGLIQVATQYSKIYEKLYNNIENDLEVPSYIEYINSEKQYMESDKYKKDEEFWNEYLKDINEPVALKNVSKKINNISKRYIVKLDKELNEKINMYCKNNKVSPYVLFLTALSTYIYRIKDINDFIIGTPVLNRSNFKEKQMLGMFVSTIPMRFKIEENIKFRDLLKTVSCDTMSIFRHQKYPYSEIIKEVHSKTDIKANLYNIVLSYQNARANYSDNKKYNAIWKEPNCIQDDLDIHIVDINNEGKLEIYYDYLIDIFDKIEIKYLHTRLIAIIEDAINNEEVTVEDIRIMSVEEEHKILYEFNDTDRDYPKDKTVIQLFEEQVENTPDNIALVFEDKKMTYRELNEKANQLANYLINNYSDVKMVSIIQKRGFNMLISILAILKSRKTYVPIDPKFPKDRITYMIENSETRLILKSKDIVYINEKIDMILIDDFKYDQKCNFKKVYTDINDDVYIIYTSGTTGLPKGVVIDNKNIVNLIYAVSEYQDIQKHNVFSCFSTYSFDIFVLETFIPLSFGKTIIMSNEEEQLFPDKISKLINYYNVEVLYMTPTRMQLLIDYKKQSDSLKSLKIIMLGGEIFPEKHFEKIKKITKAEIYNGYGPTEITVWCTSKKINSKKDINIGKALPNMKTIILDSKFRKLPIGCLGELCIGGNGVGKGYYNNIENTNKKFCIYNNNRIYKTGDCCYYNFNGDLSYVCRNDSQIKLHGLRIEIEEIENIIKKVKEIKQVAVILKNNNLIAYYTSKVDLNEIELKKFLKQKLPLYMIPNNYVKLQEFDLNVVGKIDKKKLLEIDIKEIEVSKPTNKIQNIIYNEIKKVKKVKKFGTNSDIFEQGLDSIDVIKLVNKLKEKKIYLQYNDFFDYPTIQLLSSIAKFEESDLIFKKSNENVTASQKGIFMQYMLDTENTLYNIPFDINFSKEKVNLEKLLIAINKTVLNHPILFSYFDVTSGDLKQIIPENIEYRIKSKKVTDEEYENIKINFVTSFDLLKSPLFKIEVYETVKNINILFNFHHIVFDGSSVLIFLKDMINYYNGKLVKKEKQTFLNYAINKKIKTKDIEFFKKLFEGELLINDMPYDRPRPKNINYNGNKIYKKLDKETISEIKNFICDNKVTLNSFMQSIFSIILSKYMYSEDIIYGIANSGRNNEEIDNTIGMFVKNMPYRTIIDWDKKIVDYIIDTQKNIAEILSHDSVAYEEVVKEINCTRRSDRNPLIDIMFICQNIYDENLIIENEKIKINEMHRKNSKFDITFEIIPYENDMEITVEYRTSIFDESTIAGLINNYINIIKFIIKNKSSLLKDIDMISKEEKNKIIKKFNNTKTKYPRFTSIHQIFETTVKNNSKKIAIVFEKEKLTYDELNKKANKLARLLIQKGLKKGEVVAVLIDKSSEYMIAILGILKAGCVYMPISDDMPEERIKYVINDSSTKIIITTKLFDKVENLRDKIYIDFRDDYSDYKCIENDTNLDLDTVSTEKAYIMYTSGTTGVPKGITIIHRGITRLLLNTNLVNYTSNDIMLVSSSVTFDTSGFEIWGAMFNGMTLHFIRKKHILNPSYYEKYILNESITTTLIPTPIFNQLVEYNASMFAKLKTLYVCGDVLLNNYSNKILDNCPNTKLINTYGPTENSVICTFEEVLEKTEYDISIGKIISNATCYVVDKCGKLSPIKVPGELYTGGDGLGLGYINKPEVTKEKFIKYDVLNEDIYKTGDLVSCNENGKFKFFGRIDTQVKIRGQRIEILEIQNKILDIKEINECIVILNEQKDNKFLIAYYTAKSEISEKEIISYLNKFLPNYMIPYKFVKLDEMPLNQNSKIDRKALPEIKFEKNTIKMPENKLQKKILEIYKEVLKNDNIGMDDDFFNVGGDSLLVMNLIGKLEENNINITYAEAFQYSKPLEIYNKVSNLEFKKSIEFEEKVEIYDYTKINKFIQNNVEIDVITKQNIKNVLLTGATGFLGIHILDQLLSMDNNIIIYCLVRSKDGFTPKERLYNKIQYYFGDKYNKVFDKNIIVVNGDIITNRIIYENNEKKIIDDFGIVINALAHVKHFGEKKIFEEININGTKNIVEFCIKNNKKLIHISTISVSGNLLEGGQINQDHIKSNTIYNENSLYIAQKLDNIYILSKFIAERIILEELEKGKIDAKIIRVGNLTGRYTDGKFQSNSNENAFLNRIKTFKNIKYVPENILELDVEFSPVDLTAKAICYISKLNNNNNSIYHVYNPNHIKLKEIIIYFNNNSFDIKVISKEKMTKFIKESKKNNLKNDFISGIIQDINSNNELEYQSHIKISCEKTLELLKVNNFIWPVIDKNYLIKFFKNAGLLNKNGGDI